MGDPKPMIWMTQEARDPSSPYAESSTFRVHFPFGEVLLRVEKGPSGRSSASFEERDPEVDFEAAS